MDILEQSVIRQACSSLLAAYAFALDDGRPEELAPLFAPDGVLRSGGKVLRGRSEIVQIIGERPADLVLRHQLTTTHIAVIDAQRASGRVYYLLYRANGTEAPLAMPPQPFSGGEWTANFVKSEAGWTFSELEIKRLFASAPKPA
jgi:hypothetical protein